MELNTLRKERRRNHNFLNHQNTWREEEIGLLVNETVIPERIVVQQKLTR